MTLLIISLLSVLMAATMSVVAWRMLRDEHRRSAARVATLAADIHQEPTVVALHDASPAVTMGEMFASAPESPSRLTLVASVVALVAAAATAATIYVGGDDVTAFSAQNTAGYHPTASSNSGTIGATVPLELVALGHQRDSNGLIVRGVLRNPSSGSEVSHLTAVVLLFNRDGGYIASGRAAVQTSTLGPGGETTFVVTVPGASDVERYRVSFRTERNVVPHVDLRS